MLFTQLLFVVSTAALCSGLVLAAGRYVRPHMRSHPAGLRLSWPVAFAWLAVSAAGLPAVALAPASLRSVAAAAFGLLLCTAGLLPLTGMPSLTRLLPLVFVAAVVLSATFIPFY